MPFPGRRHRHAVALTVPLVTLALATAWPASGHAAIALLQPPRVVDGTQPLTMTLVVTADTANRNYLVPDTLQIMASAELLAPVPLTLKRITPGPSTVRLRRGDLRRIEYRGEIPSSLRGQVRLEPVGIDAAPVLVTMNQATPAERAPATAKATAPDRPSAPDVAAQGAQPDGHDAPGDDAPVVPVVRRDADAPTAGGTPGAESRLTFNEPVYFAVGAHGGANAKFQVSIRYRLLEGRDPASRYWLDNLYLGYTQFSLWDLSQESKPFRDTNYRPSLFYYLADTGVRNGVVRQMSIATGVEHESNGRDGAESRSINTVFVRPTFFLGQLDDWHWTVSPKLYYYLEKNNNSDIADYRGYMDLRLAYGRPDSWEFAATLRKGTRQWYGSVDAQVTYPLARLIPGTAGYLMAGYFVGYGESLLDYNRKLDSQWRLGIAVAL